MRQERMTTKVIYNREGEKAEGGVVVASGPKAVVTWTHPVYGERVSVVHMPTGYAIAWCKSVGEARDKLAQLAGWDDWSEERDKVVRDSPRRVRDLAEQWAQEHMGQYGGVA